ncbi:PTS sugar transporter subunit IIB [Collinsella sp. zg1085]|uniref:PTS sugar transporter subunit IIB n=1 Tax=Collinsella sp. zg1085 TaxID=2844380 RepID=UPI001C0D3C36|nr:PTS sugar transporter subunit IIB [Collinsella sp. zg1085]QWT17992.1 PTS sugar transporter subunit IIB [Collinsella sp. zg1085]
MHIITVCGNGIGSSLMLAGKIQELCDAEGIQATVESMDLNAASSAKPDLFITVKELASQLSGNVVIVRSYVNGKKIREDALEAIKAAAAEV